MEQELITLFAIVIAAFLCPVLAALIPKKLVPETVFLLVAGVIIGPYCLGVASSDSAMTLLSDLGLGFLFLMAGYEIEPKHLINTQGKIGLATWVASFAIALLVIALFPNAHDTTIEWFALAIAFTTTAFGTIMPILKERGIMGTPLGNTIVSYGTWGELCPIIAIALLLSTRQTWLTIAILALFAAIAILSAVLPKRLRDKSSKLYLFIERNANTNSQMTIRFVLVLLVALITLSAVFDLDIVLGSFAAGFILRFIIPEGSKDLEHKLNGISYGFFVPLFFIVSGMAINPTAIASNPILLAIDVLGLLLIRGVPIFISLRLDPEARFMAIQDKVSVAFYCTTALPLIVAIATIGTNAGVLGETTASLLITAGAITVLIMPVLATLTAKTVKHRDRKASVANKKGKS